LLAAAYALRGVPYKWAAKGPRAFDCSGFTKAAHAAIGVRLPDGSFNQAIGEKRLTSMRVLAPGDLLFYRWNGAKSVSHVTIYVGEGWVIGTGSPGQLREVVVYPLADDLTVPCTVITYRRIRLGDDHRGG
jgi:cell wall-associated NlpC family hydrolase